ncbi:MAG: secondary thiamine-phosphate synthase enzyme YjbQ [Actinomycetota bacterium]
MIISRCPEPDGARSSTVMFHRDKLQIKTTREFEVIDITPNVEKAIITTGIEEGYALVYSPHTTCAIVVNERESGLLADIRSTLERLVPRSETYLHDDFKIRTENMHEGESKNAHSHLRQLIGGRTSEYIAVGEGSLLLGQWQRVMFIELDRAREREVLIQVCGI